MSDFTFVLDTCVASETTRPNPNERVETWLRSISAERLFLTTVSMGEILAGVEQLPHGRRRTVLAAWSDGLIASQFAGRILQFDLDAARIFGRIVASATRLGRRPQAADAQIAAIAMHHGMTVATRDIGDFEAFGVPLVNPWEG